MGTVKRVQIDLPPTAIQRLKELREKTDAASYAEVVKRALVLYEEVLSANEAGSVLLKKDSKGNTVELKFL